MSEDSGAPFPDSRICTKEVGQNRIDKRRFYHMENVLRSIIGEVVTHGRCPDYGGSVDDFNTAHHQYFRYDWEVPLRVAKLDDGVGVKFVSKSLIENHIHTLVIPQSLAMSEYHCRAADVDIQAGGPLQLDLEGIDAFVENTETVLPALRHCLGAISVEASYGWQNALTK